MGRYDCYEQLKRREKNGQDYFIRSRSGLSGFLIMALHGGEIEPGTTEIADAVASENHSFYSFCGSKKEGNRNLHLTSTEFDEPLARELAENAGTVVTIHGAKGTEPFVAVGGLDDKLKRSIEDALVQAGFEIKHADRLPGVNPHNLCNRGAGGRGVQIEISAMLRRTFFKKFEAGKREEKTETFWKFVSSLKKALSEA